MDSKIYHGRLESLQVLFGELRTFVGSMYISIYQISQRKAQSEQFFARSFRIDIVLHHIWAKAVSLESGTICDFLRAIFACYLDF